MGLCPAETLACFILFRGHAIMAVTDRQPDSPLMPVQPPSSSSSLSVTLQILSIVFYTFVAFICIGLPIAVLPGYVHDQLGFSAVIAGLAIASQYLATLLSRPFAGRLVDSLGTKPAIVYGLQGIAVSGVLTSLAVALQDWPLLSLVVLIVGRVFLGIAQGLIGVGTITWGIAQVGSQHTARAIGWNGIASYGAIAIGAPLGVVMIDRFGFAMLGVTLLGLALLALLLIRKKPSIPVVSGVRLPFWSVFGLIAPYGISLTLASIGYGTLTTFITLFYIDRGWVGAAYCLSVFGVCFILARLVFTNSISRFGGYNVAIACMTIETVGLILLWLAPSATFALVGAGLTGFGLSLVYPALGVEAVKQVPVASRGAGLSAYAVFFDLALAIAGPIMGAIALNMGYPLIFFSAAVLSVMGLALTFGLSVRKLER